MSQENNKFKVVKIEKINENNHENDINGIFMNGFISLAIALYGKDNYQNYLESSGKIRGGR